MLPDPLPLFPLGTVLFPGVELGLKIFETRYLDMIRRSLREASPFGIVAIRHGAEVGPAEPYRVGTLAEITDWTSTRQGLLALTVRGGGRFRFESVEQAADGLYLAHAAALLPEAGVTDAAPDLADRLQAMLGLARRADPSGGQAALTVADADRVCWNLAGQLPLSLAQKQALLETDTLADRIDRLMVSVDALADDNELKEQLGE